MIQRILTVGGYTSLSRVTGFIRDIILAAVLGAGPMADAFCAALGAAHPLPRDLRRGRVQRRFVPAYARIREQGGGPRAGLFADRIFTLLVSRACR